MSFINKLKSFMDPHDQSKPYQEPNDRHYVDVKPISRNENQQVRQQSTIDPEASQTNYQNYQSDNTQNNPQIQLQDIQPNDQFMQYIGATPYPIKTNKLRFIYKNRTDPVGNILYTASEGLENMELRHAIHEIDPQQDYPLVKPVAPDTSAEQLKHDLHHPEDTKKWHSPIDGPYTCAIKAYYDSLDRHKPLTTNDYDQLMAVTKTNHQIGAAYMLGINYDKGIQNHAIDIITGLPIPAHDLLEFSRNYQQSPVKYEDCRTFYEKQLLTYKCAPESSKLELELLITKGSNDTNPRAQEIKKYGQHFNPNGYYNAFEVAYQFDDPKAQWRELYNSVNYRKYTNDNCPHYFTPIVSPQEILSSFEIRNPKYSQREISHYLEKTKGSIDNLKSYMVNNLNYLDNYATNVLNTLPSKQKLQQNNQDYFNLWNHYAGDQHDLKTMLDTGTQYNHQHIQRSHNVVNPQIPLIYDVKFDTKLFNDQDDLACTPRYDRAPFASNLRNQLLQRLQIDGLAKTWQHDHQNYPNLLDDRNIPYQLQHPEWQKYPIEQNPSYVEEILNLTYMSVIPNLPNLAKRSPTDMDTYRTLMQKPLINDQATARKYRQWANHDLDVRRDYLKQTDPYLCKLNEFYPYHNQYEQLIESRTWNPATMLVNDQARQYAIKQQATMQTYNDPYETIRKQQEQLKTMQQQYQTIKNNYYDAMDAVTDTQKIADQQQQRAEEAETNLASSQRHNQQLHQALHQSQTENEELYQAWKHTENQNNQYAKQTDDLNQQLDQLQAKNRQLKLEKEAEKRHAAGQRNAGYQQGYKAGQQDGPSW